MRKVLQKLLLVGAVALIAFGANAYVVTKCWENTTNIPGVSHGGDFRFASVKDGKIIVTDQANKKIMAIDENGMTELFDLTEAINTHYGVEEGKEETTASWGITVDDAENILVGTGSPYATTSTDLIIISADLQNTYKLQITLPEGISSNRIDQYGKIVGNMLSSEGAYLWLAINGQENVAIIKIANGVQVQEYSIASSDVTVIMNTSTLAQPALWNVAEIDALVESGNASKSFWTRNRSNAQYM